MPKTVGKPIDPEKLRKEVLKRGMTLADMSRALGRASSYLNHSMQSGTMIQSTIYQLESMFNLKYSQIKPDEPEPQKPRQMETPELLLGGQMVFSAEKPITAKQLETIIYNAVKRAFEETTRGGNETNDGTEN